MTTENVVAILIKLEECLSALYQFFGEIFPDDLEFWNQLSREEIAHSKLLNNYYNYLPLEFQKMDKKIILRIAEEIRDNLKRFQSHYPSIEDALNYAEHIEQEAGESHYQALLEEASSAERIKVFQTLNFADKDHLKRIVEYRSKKP